VSRLKISGSVPSLPAILACRAQRKTLRVEQWCCVSVHNCTLSHAATQPALLYHNTWSVLCTVARSTHCSNASVTKFRPQESSDQQHFPPASLSHENSSSRKPWQTVNILERCKAREELEGKKNVYIYVVDCRRFLLYPCSIDSNVVHLYRAYIWFQYLDLRRTR